MLDYGGGLDVITGESGSIYKWNREAGEGIRVRKRLEDAMKMEKGPRAKEHRWPLEARKSLQKEPNPANTLTWGHRSWF